MLVKNIVKASAEYLGLKDLIKALDSDIEIDNDIQEEINNFVLAVNMVNNNIASSYIELLAKATVCGVCEKVRYSDITDKTIIDIKSIESLSGEKINFKLFPDGIEVGHSCDCIVEYTYFPDKVTIDDKIDHYLKVNELLFSLGVVGEYLYIKGAIDDAYMWDKRFKTAMFNVNRPRRNIQIPARRWE